MRAQHRRLILMAWTMVYTHSIGRHESIVGQNMTENFIHYPQLVPVPCLELKVAQLRTLGGAC